MNKSIFLIALILLVSCNSAKVVHNQPEGVQSYIGNEKIRCKVIPNWEMFDLLFQAKDKDGRWIDVATNLSQKSTKQTFLSHPLFPAIIGNVKAGFYNSADKSTDNIFMKAEVDAESSFQTITLKGEYGVYDVYLNVKCKGNSGFFHVSLEIQTAKGPTSIEYLLNTFAFLPKSVDFAWLPNLRPNDGMMAGDHIFRSPFALLQSGSVMMALAPDLDTMRKNDVPYILDLDKKSKITDYPIISYGVAPYAPVGHVYYYHDSSMLMRLPVKLKIEYYLFLDADATPLQGYRQITHFLWDKYGTRYFKDILPQVLPYGEYGEKYVFKNVFDKEWVEFELDGKKVGGINGKELAAIKNIVNQSWFCNMRSAYGMYLWGKNLEDKELKRKANLMKEMALAAPQNDGIFPSIYIPAERKWKSCLVGPLGMGPDMGYYHTPDAAWKGIWMLKWFSDIEKDGRLIDYCKKLGNFFVNNQEKSGAIPSWFTSDLEAVDILKESAQTAMPCYFLAELYRITKDEKYLSAAIRGAEFVIKEVIPHMKYYDFETYFSCSRKPLTFKDEHTGIEPQNNLSIQWTCEMLKSLYEISGEKHYLDEAVRVLDVMCLYQQVWPMSQSKKVYNYGGFGVQNTDAEYNDARQSQFACTLADFYDVTGNPEYFERGIASLRASFALINTPENKANEVCTHFDYPEGFSPENSGHNAQDDPAGRTTFDWGEGSALAGAAYIMQKYGGAYIDLKNKHAFGIDGCRATYEEKNGKVILSITNELVKLVTPTENLKIKVKFTGIEKEAYTININGNEKKYTRAELQEGINLTLP